MKSANQWCRILDPEKTYSTSSPFIHSLFFMYLQLEAKNVLLKGEKGGRKEEKREGKKGCSN